MNKMTFRNCVVTAILGAAIAAVVSLGIAPTHSQPESSTRIVISAHHAILVADGSESNGGKGGGKGNS